MALEGTGGSELTQLVTDHILSHINGDVLLTIVNCDRVTDEFREYGRCAGPGFENFLLVLFIHGANAGVELCFYERRTVGRMPL